MNNKRDKGKPVSLIKHVTIIVIFNFIFQVQSAEFKQGKQITELPKILSHRDRVKPANDIVKHRLDHLLPRLMQETELDMWLVINREYEEDPLFYSLVPHTTFAARRTTILVFVRSKSGDVKRFTVSRYPIAGFYESKWKGGSQQQQWQRLAEIIKEYDPKKIGINTSINWPLSDGLTHGLYQQLFNVIDPKYQQRLTSAEPLVIRWMETRIQPELEIYPHIVEIARAVIAEAFSSKVIMPGVTTTDDVAWYIRERFESLQLRPWFQPYVNIQRKGDDVTKEAPFYGKSGIVIIAGDVLHTDVGICYLKLCTDTQEMGYVLRLGESDVPQGLKRALAKGNQWQDSLTDSFKAGLTGNQILANAKKQSRKANLEASIYTHPIGFVGHAIGPTIGMWDNQGDTPVRGDWPLNPNTAYAIEGNIKIPVAEWDNQWVQIKLEQTAVFDGNHVIYLGGRQTRWHLVE